MNTHTEIRFDPSEEDTVLIESIVARFGRFPYQPRPNKRSLAMDLTACHLNGCPLDLEGLLKAGDFDFVHDVAGIARHMNRGSRGLMGGFHPRYAAKDAFKAQEEEEQTAHDVLVAARGRVSQAVLTQYAVYESRIAELESALEGARRRPKGQQEFTP